jgi:hypothetical protein
MMNGDSTIDCFVGRRGNLIATTAKDVIAKAVKRYQEMISNGQKLLCLYSNKQNQQSTLHRYHKRSYKKSFTKCLMIAIMQLQGKNRLRRAQEKGNWI